MVNSGQMCKGPDGSLWPCETYPPLSVGVRPKRVQSPTDMRSELSTVTTAARARPHLDLTMSILPKEQRQRIRQYLPQPLEPFVTELLRTEHAVSPERESSCSPRGKGQERVLPIS